MIAANKPEVRMSAIEVQPESSGQGTSPHANRKQQQQAMIAPLTEDEDELCHHIFLLVVVTLLQSCFLKCPCTLGCIVLVRECLCVRLAEMGMSILPGGAFVSKGVCFVCVFWQLRCVRWG